jgi:hypothetical protein
VLQFIPRQDRDPAHPRQVFRFLVHGQDPNRSVTYEAALTLKHKHDRWLAARHADRNLEAAQQLSLRNPVLVTKAKVKLVAPAMTDCSADDELQAAHQLYVGRPAVAAHVAVLQQLVSSRQEVPAAVSPAKVQLLLSEVDLNSCSKFLSP